MSPLNLTRSLGHLLRRHPVRREDLSAYLDERLPPRERDRLDEHLAACSRCRRELEELRVVVRALQGLSHVPVRRSFRLSPEQVEATRVAARPTWAHGALGAVAATAAIVFAVLLAGDLLTLEGVEDAAAPAGGAPAGLMSQRAEEALEADEGLPTGAGLEAEGTPLPEPTTQATPPAVPRPATEEPAQAFAPPVPTQPPEAEELREPDAAEEEDGGTDRLAVRVGEAAAAAAALAALGGLLVLWRRRARI
jgi:hypothetical protein